MESRIVCFEPATTRFVAKSATEDQDFVEGVPYLAWMGGEKSSGNGHTPVQALAESGRWSSWASLF